ncbi:hypothetical protein DV736_g865, partial [Chaetothyriales sp. CBS 134916]
MTTLKPQLVRADTLDLQTHDAPSAQDHSRQPQHPAPYGYGPAAPHQAQTLRHAEEDAFHQQQTSPRVSDEGVRGGLFSADQAFYDDPDDEIDDEHINHFHGVNGVHAQDHDYDDAEASDSHDEDMDDDLMDKISSSPSIEDGKYSLPHYHPRPDSADDGASPAPFSPPNRGVSPLSALFLPPPVLFRAPSSQEQESCAESHLGEEGPFKPQVGSQHRHPSTYRHNDQSGHHSAHDAFTHVGHQIAPIPSYLLPPHDPVLSQALDDGGDEGFFDDEDAWEDLDINSPDYKSSSDDESADIPFTAHSRFIDSGWGGECLREIEDIDFEFVYALHTFVATVEGQANATKGDTMVLLDDSNSYWWLVRVVKDGSIGYLPAEHIETPTERLARLNKHRNIDLSASMLGDNPEKSKNPLKKAMRRRNAKTVQFTAPTYYEPSEYDYSDDEEADDSQLEPGDAGEGGDLAEEHEATQHQVEDIVGPTQDNQHYDDNVAVNGLQKTTSNESIHDDQPTSQVKPSTPDPSPVSSSSQEPVSRSRKGVVRNTDSFFKDDTAETKKISLTPRLLRGDLDIGPNEQSELRQRPSEETFDKILHVDEKPKEQPKKEKKGMLSGLFKRKDKTAKVQISQDRPEKTSEDSLPHSPVSKDSLDSFTGPERKPSKLQKTPPTQPGPGLSPTEPRAPQPDQAVGPTSAVPPAPSGPAPAPPNITHEVDHSDEPDRVQDPLSVQTRDAQFTPSTGRSASVQGESTANASISDNPQSSVATESELSRASDLSPRSRVRSALAADDSEDDETSAGDLQLQKQWSVSPVNETQRRHRRNDSGMEISPISSTAAHDGPARNQHESLFADEPNHAEEKSTSPTQAAGSTPIDFEATSSTSKPSPSTATTHTLSTSRSTPTWSDASLRTYLESDQDIKDLLIIVHDRANVPPVSPDHPLVANLFSTERTKLTEMQSQLDNLLLGWMSRKNATLLSR